MAHALRLFVLATLLAVSSTGPSQAQDPPSMCAQTPVDAANFFVRTWPHLANGDTDVCPKACKTWVSACIKQVKGAEKCLSTEAKNEAKVALVVCKALLSSPAQKACRTAIKNDLKRTLGTWKADRREGIADGCRDFGSLNLCIFSCKILSD